MVLTAVVTLLAGVGLTVWAVPRVAPWLDGWVQPDSPDFLKMALAVVLYSPIVLVGLVVYHVGAGLLTRCGLPLWTEPEPVAAFQESTSDPLRIGHLELSHRPDQLIVRLCAQEFWMKFLFSLLMAPLFALIGLWCLRSQWREPGKLGLAFLRDNLGVDLDPTVTFHRAVAILIVSLGIVVMLGLAAFCGRDAFRSIRFGNRPWVLDRRGDLFLLGDATHGPLSSIRWVQISRLRVKLRFNYYVGFAPQAHPVSQTFFLGLRDDLFTFGKEGDAEQFAGVIADFLETNTVKEYSTP